MTFLLNLLEEGARPGILTRRIELQGRSEARLSLYMDLSTEQGRAPGLRRTLLVDAEQKPRSEKHLSLIGTLRCEIELGAFQVVFLPHRTQPGAEKTVQSQWRQHLSPMTRPREVDPLDGLDLSQEGLDDASELPPDFSLEDSLETPLPGPRDAGGGRGGASSGPRDARGRPGARVGSAGTSGWGGTGRSTPPRDGGTSTPYFISTLLPDGTVRPLGREERPDSGTRFRIKRQFRQPNEDIDAPPVTIELSWSDEESQELGRMRSSAPDVTQRISKDADVVWQIPELSQALESPFNRLVEAIQVRAAKAGISTAILFAAVGVMGSITTAIGYSLYVHRVAAEAENSASAALEQSERATEAANGATQREQECLGSVAQTLKNSGDIGNAEREQARIRLAPTLGEIEFRRTWGEPPSRTSRDDVARRQRLSGLLQLIIDRRAGRRNEQLPAAILRQRMLFANNAKPDLPTHVLLWHTHPRQAEASGYFRQEAGIDFRGFFGLSSRVKREFERSSGYTNLFGGGYGSDGAMGAARGAAAAGVTGALAGAGAGKSDSGGLSAGLGLFGKNSANNDAVSLPSGLENNAGTPDLRRPDPRDRDDWSANTHLEGLRRIRHALLTSDTGGRLPVYPEQLHLWTMALWYGYNFMPDLKSGRTPSVNACVQNLMLNLALFRLESPDSNVPALPDIREVINARAWTGGPLGATALCPWREERLYEGARHAIDSVADQWLMEENDSVP